MFKRHLYARSRPHLYARSTIACLSVIYMLGEPLSDLVVFYVGGNHALCPSHRGHARDLHGYTE